VGAAVTIRELLYQTSGIPNFTEGNDFMLVASTHTPSLQAILGRITGKPLAFPPGSDCAYSNMQKNRSHAAYYPAASFEIAPRHLLGILHDAAGLRRNRHGRGG
jgi:hypothetical protein